MAKVVVCDVCRKPTDKIVMKLFRSPDHRHENYDGHADVGACCAPSINRTVKFRDRVRKVKVAAGT
jgi:hypothetical protein